MNRLEKLKELEAELKELMNKANSRSFAPLAKQYRETLKEIEEREGVNTNDEIGDILAEREADGKAGAVRQSRAG